MSKTRIVFLDRSTLPSSALLPKLEFEHEWSEYDATPLTQIIERAKDADIIITNKVPLDEDILRDLPSLKMIAIAATGYNNVDVEYCRKHNIAITNVQGYANQSVPEHVIGLMFALQRNLVGYHNDIANGEWQRNKQFCFFTHPIREVCGSTMGIIGRGELGAATGALAQSLGMKVVYAEHKGVVQCRDGYLPFEQVLASSDVISLHCPLNTSTHRLIGRHELALMKPCAVLINTGRGGLVDEEALVDSLKEGRLGGAGVDVFTDEPAGESNSLVANMHLPNLLLTPHVAWGTSSAIDNLMTILMDNVRAFLDGEEKNRIV